MPKRRIDNDHETLAEVNIIPLADVCLTLVIIIMVISPMIMQSMIQVQASQAVTGRFKEPVVHDKPIFVDLTSSGMSVNNKRVATEYELFRTLQQYLLGSRDKTVLISAAAQVRYENVVRVLDIIKQSGAKSLALIPRKQEPA